MWNPSESALAGSHEEQIQRILLTVFGEVPLLRGDTPLTSLGFQPEHAVMLVHQAESVGVSCPRDLDFARVVTVQDFTEACASGSLMEPEVGPYVVE
jgi:hypothetical protein